MQYLGYPMKYLQWTYTKIYLLFTWNNNLTVHPVFYPSTLPGRPHCPQLRLSVRTVVREQAGGAKFLTLLCAEHRHAPTRQTKKEEENFPDSKLVTCEDQLISSPLLPHTSLFSCVQEYSQPLFHTLRNLLSETWTPLDLCSWCQWARTS